MWVLGEGVEEIVKRLNEDKGIASDARRSSSSLFEETRELRVLLEPDYSIALILTVLVRNRGGVLPAVESVQLRGSIVGEKARDDSRW